MAIKSKIPGLIPLGMPGTNLYMQIGHSSFSGVYTDSTDVPIRTSLNEIEVALAVVDDSYSPATDVTMTEYHVFAARDISSSTFSVHRSSQGAVSGLPFSYIVIGRLYATS